jgi:hypothetical protein
MMKISKTIGQRPLPPELHAILGEILVEWAWMEFRLQEAIWHLLSVPRKEGRTLTSEMQVDGLVGALSVIATRKIQDATIKQQVDGICKRIKGKISRRNVIIHGAWDYDTINKLATARKYRKDPIGGKAHVWDKNKLSNFLFELKADRVLLQQLLDQV